MVTSTNQPTNQQGEYRAICLFRKLENRKKAEICNSSINFFLVFSLLSSSNSQSVVCAKPNLLLARRSTTRLLHSAEASQECFKAFHKALKLSHISLKLSISMRFSNSTGVHRHSKKIRRHHWLDQHLQQHQRLDQHQNLPQHQR